MGQNFTDWADQLRQLGDEADLASLEIDDMYIMRYFTGVKDVVLRAEFLKEENPTLARLMTIARTYEVGNTSLQAMGAQIKALGGKTQFQKKNSGKQTRKQASAQTSNLNVYKSGKAGKCMHCGELQNKLYQAQRHLLGHFFAPEVAQNIDLNDLPEVF